MISIISIGGATFIHQPLGVVKQTPGKAMKAALSARIPANEAVAPCV
jgi:hypothetical protein